MILKVLEIEVGSKNRSKIEAQDGWPLGIDFWWILMGFGRQVGLENQAKIEKKTTEKAINKNGGEKARLGGLQGGTARRGCDAGATQALTASGCPQEPPVSKITSKQNTSTG